MGVNSENLRFLCGSLKGGLKIGRMLTLGRQQYFDHRRCLEVLREYGYAGGPSFFDPQAGYADEVFRVLGAASLDSVDVSAYEHATIIHDMNTPVPTELAERFDFIFDGGTLEHVLNVSVALRNCQAMVKTGGHVLLTLVANNFMGHGFYQFSPEFLFANFTAAEGFEIKSAVLVEGSRPSRWFALSNPAEAGSRVCLVNRRPVLILALARKVGPPAQANVPMQSDYETVWKNESTAYDLPDAARKTRRDLVARIPERWRKPLVRFYRRHYVDTLRNRSFYAPMAKKGFVVPS